MVSAVIASVVMDCGSVPVKPFRVYRSTHPPYEVLAEIENQNIRFTIPITMDW